MNDLEYGWIGYPKIAESTSVEFGTLGDSYGLKGDIPADNDRWEISDDVNCAITFIDTLDETLLDTGVNSHVYLTDGPKHIFDGMDAEVRLDQDTNLFIDSMVPMIFAEDFDAGLDQRYNIHDDAPMIEVYDGLKVEIMMMKSN